MSYSVNQLATLANVSVRTLHYYDTLGLLTPQRDAKGYRWYEEADLITLQQILFWRELEFSLGDIQRIMRAPDYTVLAALQDQQAMLQLKAKRLKQLIQSINQTIETMTNQDKIQPEELYDVFKDDDVKQYQAEVKERWGNTDAYKQSMQRVSKLTKPEMDKLKADSKKHMQALADAMPKGIQHSDVQALIQQSYDGVNFFYDCSLEMFRHLGKMYVEDPRFTATYDAYAPGLAKFVHEAIDYYCDQRAK